jgi:predicted DNA-binding transcriptional regulator YafY
MSQNVPKPKIRKISRIHKVLEQRAKGKTIAEIATDLSVSEKTVDRDLKTETAQAFLDEIIQQQIIDITQAEDIEIRLGYRSDLLEKLLPKKSEIKQDVTTTGNTKETSELLRLIATIDKQLSKTDTLSEDNSTESIHT